MLVGAFAGAAGPLGVAAVAGLGAAGNAVAHFGSEYLETVQEGMSDNPLMNLALGASAIFAAGVILTSVAGGGGALGLGLATLVPTNLVGAAVGAAAGAGLGIWN